jgi:hypothetical protein
MNKEFIKWLKKQEYTLTNIGILYVWDELVHAANYNNRVEEIDRREYTWGLWRKAYE